MNYGDNLDDFWNTCKPKIAHINEQYQGQAISPNVATWAKSFNQRYGINAQTFVVGKRVLEYGIGAGHTGAAMLAAGASHYIGVDIATRQLELARGMLERFGGQFELNLTPVDYRSFNPDVILSEACIQHFPDKSYTADFFAAINTSGAAWLLLQYRYGDKWEHDRTNPIHACRLTLGDVGECLTNYDLTHECKQPKTNYQYTAWKIKGE